MTAIDEAARRLGLTPMPTRSLVTEMARNWKRPSLAMVLLLSGLKNYFKRICHSFRSFSASLPPEPSLSFEIGGPKTPFSAIGASAALSIVSFFATKLWYLYIYLNPLNRLTRQAYIDSRHGSQVESHKWLTCILEASPQYKTSRDLEATTFQSVRERQTSDDSIVLRYNGRGLGNRLKVIHDPSHSRVEVPIFFQPRKTGEFWFVKFGTLFRISKEGSTNAFSAASEGPRLASDDDYDSEPAITVRCFSRTRKPLMQLLAYAKEEYFKGFKQNLYCQVFTFDGHHWCAGSIRKGRGLDTIIIPEKTKQKLLDDVEEFLESQEWYSSRGIPWKRGIMFSGPPGNGKSSTIQALASTFDLPIYILPVASAGFSDSMLSRSMSRVASKCIIVLEDFDALQIQNSHRMPEIPVIANQPVALSGGRLSLSTILNVLDGIDSGEGRIVIASTNHLDFLQLDEALLRPGRFDLFIEFKKATKEQARELFLQFYKDYRSKVEVLEEGILPDADINTNTKFTLGVKEVKVLADEFKDMVGDEEFSVAALQGHLIAHKTNPYLAVQAMPNFLSESRKAPNKSDANGSDKLPSPGKAEVAVKKANGASKDTASERVPEYAPKVRDGVKSARSASGSVSSGSTSGSEDATSDSTSESQDASSTANTESSID